MLLTTSALKNHEIRAADGRIGSIRDLLFEDSQWAVRWLVLDLGTWLTGKRVLLSPEALRGADPVQRLLETDLTRAQIEAAPHESEDLPVSRQQEIRLTSYYGWNPYWGPLAMPGTAAYLPLGEAMEPVPAMAPEEPKGDPHLRSAKEITGYRLHALDGEIGHVEDLLIEVPGWAIRYVLVDTRNWWPGKTVLMSPGWIAEVSWAEREVRVDMSRHEIEQAPEYDPNLPIERGYEERLYGHYGRPGYWR
jgi:hypothetical protein